MDGMVGRGGGPRGQRTPHAEALVEVLVEGDDGAVHRDAAHHAGPVAHLGRRGSRKGDEWGAGRGKDGESEGRRRIR